MEIEAVQRLIREEGEYVTNLLIEKNNAYGNSAITPKRFFSKADGVEQIKVRIDDKLNRLVNGLSEEDEEDVVLDLIGYLILLRVAQRVQDVTVKDIFDPQKQNFITSPPGFCDCQSVNFGFRHLKGAGCTS